jgi:hypothetical protein
MILKPSLSFTGQREYRWQGLEVPAMMGKRRGTAQIATAPPTGCAAGNRHKNLLFSQLDFAVWRPSAVRHSKILEAKCDAADKVCSASCGGWRGGCQAGPKGNVLLSATDRFKFECGVKAFNSGALSKYICQNNQCVPSATGEGVSQSKCKEVCIPPAIAAVEPVARSTSTSNISDLFRVPAFLSLLRARRVTATCLGEGEKCGLTEHHCCLGLGCGCPVTTPPAHPQKRRSKISTPAAFT